VGIEDLIRQIEEDERQDALAVLEFMPIGKYARVKGVRYQRIYQLIKSGKLEKHFCPCCGTLVVRIEDANAALGEGKDTTRAGVRTELMDEEENNGPELDMHD
jgi:hypothetical protein